MKLVFGCSSVICTGNSAKSYPFFRGFLFGIESLAKFPRRTASSSAQSGPPPQQPSEQQQTVAQNASNNHSSGLGATMQIKPSNGVNYAVNAASTSTSTSNIAGLIHQNSMKPNGVYNPPNNPYGGNSVLMPSPSTSGTMAPSSQQQQKPNLPSFQSPTSSSNNNNHMGSTNSQAAEVEANESSSVEKILNELLMNNNKAHNSSSSGGSMVGNGSKAGNVNSSGGQVDHSNTNIGRGAGGFSGEMAQSNGIGINRNNSLVNGRGGGMMVRDPNVQQDLGNQYLGTVNGFNNFQCDWNG